MEKPVVTRMYQLIGEGHEPEKVAEILGNEFTESDAPLRYGAKRLSEMILPAIKDVVRHNLIKNRRHCPIRNKSLDN